MMYLFVVSDLFKIKDVARHHHCSEQCWKISSTTTGRLIFLPTTNYREDVCFYKDTQSATRPKKHFFSPRPSFHRYGTGYTFHTAVIAIVVMWT